MSSVYYALKDHLNSVLALTDSFGQIAESYRYDAWGRVLGVYNASGSQVSQSQIGNRYLWQGREYSWKTGLYNFRARWYEPVTGRWLSNDPIGISGGLNQYVFCGNNPVNFVDPFGLCRDGDATLSNIRTFIDTAHKVADASWWVPRWYVDVTTELALHSGPGASLDFNSQDDGRDFMVNGSRMRFDAFGNYTAGYTAGYAGTPGLYTGVRIGGLFWANMPGSTESRDDRESVPAINQGFEAGQRARNR